MIKQRLLLIGFLFLSLVFNWDSSAFAQVVWSAPYTLKKNHTIYLYGLQEYGGCGHFLTTTDGEADYLEDEPASSNFQNTLNNSSWDNFFWYTNVGATDLFYNPNLSSSAPSPYFYTSTDKKTYIQFGMVGDCGVIDNTTDNIYWDTSAVSLSQSSVNNTPTDLEYDFDTPIYCQSCGDDGYGYIQDFNTVEYFTDVQKPQTLVFYVGGDGSDPYKSNSLLYTLQGDLSVGGNEGQFDIEVFPQYPGTFGNHKSIVQNLINFLINLDPSAYTNVFIITHSAGYFYTKLAVMATDGVAYNNDAYTFNDSDNNNQQSALGALFQKAQIIALSPPLGGASHAQEMPPILIKQDMNPSSAIEAWMANYDSIFKDTVGGFQSYEILGDGMYHGVWSTRNTGGFNEPAWGYLVSGLENFGAIFPWLHFTSNTIETKNYMIEASQPWKNYNEWPPSVGNGSPSSFHVEFPMSIGPITPKSAHHYLCNYYPMEQYIENLILAAQNNAQNSAKANLASSAFKSNSIMSVPKMLVPAQKFHSKLNDILSKIGKKNVTIMKRAVFKPLLLPKSNKIKPSLKTPLVKAVVVSELKSNSSPAMSQLVVQPKDVTASGICSDYQDLLTYVYNTTDGCYAQFINNVAAIPCSSDISSACDPNVVTYPDNYDGYNSPTDCENYLTADAVLNQYDSLSDYYQCEISSQSCASGSTTVFGNQPYYCGSGGNWIPSESQGQSCTANIQCASNQCSTTCQGANPYSNAPVFQTVGANNVTNGVIPHYNVPIGSNLSFTVTASSPVKASLIYSASNLPSGAGFSSGTFSWTPQAGQDGTFTALFTVSTNSSPVLSTAIPVVISAGSGVNSTSVSWSGSVSLPTSFPTVTLANGTTYSVTNSTGVNLSITGSETGGLGASFMQFSTDSANWGTLQPFSKNQYYIFPAGDGIKTIYVRFKDVVGNISPVYSSAPIILDTTAPAGSIQINGGSAYTVSSSVNLTLGASDNLTGVVWMVLSNDNQNWTSPQLYSASYAWNLPSTLASGSSQTIYVKYEDGAGNWSPAYSASIILDTGTPTGSIQINHGAAYTNSTSVTLGLSATDSVSGISKMSISNDNTNWTTCAYATSYAWSLPASLSNGSSQTVYAKFQNGAGVWSTVYSASITLDQITGMISINDGATVTNSLTATLSLSASAASAITSMRIANTQSAVATASSVAYAQTTSWTLASGNGSKTVYVQFEDSLGNWSPVYSSSITLNIVGSVAINGGAPYTNSSSVTLTLVPPSMAAAVQSMYIANSQAALSSTPPVAYAATKIWTLVTSNSGPGGTGNGSNTVYVRYKDASNNMSPVYSASIILDTTSPTGSITINGGATYSNFTSVTLTLAATDSISGVSNMAVSNDNANWTTVPYSTSYAWNLPSSLANGSVQKVYVKYQSGAGNWSPVYSSGIILETVSFNVTASSDANGSISPSGVVSVYYAASQAFTITPNAGYILSQLLVDSSAVTVKTINNISSYTLSNVIKAHTVAASFKPVIAASAGTGGSISPSGNVTFSSGSSQTFTVTANTGYTLNQVLVDGTAVSLASGNKYTFSNLTAPHTIAASFTINTYPLTISAGANGSISPSGTVTANYGSSQLFTITPNTGYVINQLLVDGGAVTVTTSNNVSSYTLSNMTKAHTITASFKPVIIASASAGGAISPAGTVNFTSGGSQAFTVTPNTGYSITQVLVDGAPVILATGNKYTFNNLTGPHTIAASFAINTFIVTPSAGVGGSISPAGGVTVNYGANQTFTITPNPGYLVNQLLVDNKAVTLPANNTITLTNVTAAHTIAVSFKTTITATTGANGYISPRGAVILACGSSQTFTISTAIGYMVNQVLVDGSPVTLASGNQYTFSNLAAPHTIAASFMTPFTATLGINNGAAATNSTAVTLNLSAADTLSTITSMRIANSPSSVLSASAVAYATTAKWTLSSVNGSETVFVQFEDALGNWSPIYSASIVLDTTAPTGSISINGGASYTTSTSVTLALTASDNLTGVVNMAISNDNTNWTTVPFATSYTWKLPSALAGGNSQTIYIRYQDGVGNWSSVYSSSILLDTLAGTRVLKSVSWYNGGATCSYAGGACPSNYYFNPRVNFGSGDYVTHNDNTTATIWCKNVTGQTYSSGTSNLNSTNPQDGFRYEYLNGVWIGINGGDYPRYYVCT